MTQTLLNGSSTHWCTEKPAGSYTVPQSHTNSATILLLRKTRDPNFEPNSRVENYNIYKSPEGTVERALFSHNCHEADNNGIVAYGERLVEFMTEDMRPGDSTRTSNSFLHLEDIHILNVEVGEEYFQEFKLGKRGVIGDDVDVAPSGKTAYQQAFANLLYGQQVDGLYVVLLLNKMPEGEEKEVMLGQTREACKDWDCQGLIITTREELSFVDETPLATQTMLRASRTYAELYPLVIMN